VPNCCQMNVVVDRVEEDAVANSLDVLPRACPPNCFDLKMVVVKLFGKPALALPS